jgi:LacI family transcriptional regulator
MIDEELVVTGDYRSDSGGKCLVQLMQAEKPPTAVFACNDIMAIGAMTAARQLGYNVPDQLSIVGFDDIAMSSMVIPTLTTVAQPKRELGETGAKLLLQRIVKGSHTKETTIILEPTLVIRESSAPPR